MSGDPRFSVVIPAYRAPRTIVSAIRSVLAQTEEDLELIVVDDGSGDETPEVARRTIGDDPRGRVIEQANRGVAGARNTGIGEARGEYVSFLDNDDLWLPRYLSQMGEALKESSRVGLAYTDGYTLDDANKKIRVATTMSNANPTESSIEDRTELILRLVESNFILSSSTARRDVLNELGGFDTSVTGVDDFDMWLRIVAAGYEARRTRDRLVIQRERFDSQSKDPVLMARAHLETLLRLQANPGAPAPAVVAAGRAAERTRAELEMLSGDRTIARLLYETRLLIGRAKRRLAGPPASFDQPPAEIADAFPDLSDV
ncbi:hypothetical protein BH10ACT11_BH10ACT11_16170 [soil metagenome]